MTELGDWSNHENGRYIGKIDRIYISMTDYYFAEYFIDTYLKNRGYTINNRNRNIIATELERYNGEHPYSVSDLLFYLDRRIK